LTPLGFELKEAKNGQQAIDIWKDWSPHCILMDMRMPIMDGYEATRQIKALSDEVVIIAVTASAFNDKKQAVFQAGCDDFISKPYKKEAIFSLLKKYLSLEYIVENEAELVEEVSNVAYLSKHSINQLEEALKTELKQAITCVDIQKIKKLLEQVSQQDSPLAEAIQQQIDSF